MSGTLWLIPVPLGPVSPQACLPATTLAAARGLRYVVAESARTARAFLKALPCETPIQAIRVEEIGEAPSPARLDALLAPLEAGTDAGVVSEAGAPGIADPGALLVARAHARGLPVRPCVGPSSLMLALMGSGLEGQRFAFHGYLPVEPGSRLASLRGIEEDSARQARTQLWIETPYRNQQMLEAALAALRPGTRLCVAAELTLPSEWIRCATIADWRSGPKPALDRRPAVFLLQAAASSPAAAASAGRRPNRSGTRPQVRR